MLKVNATKAEKGLLQVVSPDLWTPVLPGLDVARELLVHPAGVPKVYHLGGGRHHPLLKRHGVLGRCEGLRIRRRWLLCI